MTLAQLASAGTTVIGAIFAGLLLGLAAMRYLHWEWAVPILLVLGFVGGLVATYRRLAALQ